MATKEPYSVGSVPESMVPLRFNFCRYRGAWAADGSVPERRVWSSCSSLRVVEELHHAGGRVPLIWLSPSLAVRK
jgi:hypothetical protein